MSRALITQMLDCIATLRWTKPRGTQQAKATTRWLYFTKCEGAETTTNNQWTVRSGKTSREETMEIKTK